MSPGKQPRTRPRGQISNAPVGGGHLSPSLGAADPQIRRNAGMAIASQMTLNKTMHVDKDGRHGVRPMTRVKRLETPQAVSATDMAEMAARLNLAEAKMNELLTMMSRSGFMKGGP